MRKHLATIVFVLALVAVIIQFAWQAAADKPAMPGRGRPPRAHEWRKTDQRIRRAWDERWSQRRRQGEARYRRYVERSRSH